MPGGLEAVEEALEEAPTLGLWGSPQGNPSTVLAIEGRDSLYTTLALSRDIVAPSDGVNS